MMHESKRFIPSCLWMRLKPRHVLLQHYIRESVDSLCRDGADAQYTGWGVHFGNSKEGRHRVPAKKSVWTYMLLQASFF